MVLKLKLNSFVNTQTHFNDLMRWSLFGFGPGNFLFTLTTLTRIIFRALVSVCLHQARLGKPPRGDVQPTGLPKFIVD
jgi:hypothetical protein